MNPLAPAMALGVAGILAGLGATDEEANAVWASLLDQPLPLTAGEALHQVRAALATVREQR